MGDEHQRGPALGDQLEHQGGDKAGGRGVEIAGGLVGEQQFRADGQGAGDRDALLLAARELVRVVVMAGAEPDPLEPVAGLALRAGAAVDFERGGDILDRRHVGQQMEVLEHQGHAAAAQGGAPILVLGRQVLAEQAHNACGRPLEPGGDRDERGFARAGGPDDRHPLAAGDAQVRAHEHFDDASATGQAQADALHLQHGLVRHVHHRAEVGPAVGGAIPPRVRIARQAGLSIFVCMMAFLRTLLAPMLLTAAAAHASAPPVVTVLGDSITAGLGLPTEAALPAQLGAALARLGVRADVRGAGVSGDTTAGGLARVGFSVASDTRVCVVELGANDYLQSVPPAQTERNLDAIVRRLKARGIAVLLAGGKVPASSTGSYGTEFDAIFASVAGREGVALEPNFLGAVQSDAALKQADGMHPNAAGVRDIADRLAPRVAALIRG